MLRCSIRLPLFAAAISVIVSTAAAQEGGTEMEVYGFVMTDMGTQTNQNDPNWFDVVRPTKLPAFPNEFGTDGNFFASVRQSRLGVRTNTQTSAGELRTIFEFELFGTGVDAGQTTFRLRHAWGELGKFGAGQTWSLFMDPDVFPNSIEYWGPNGMVFFRNVQMRWTPWQTSSGSRFALALERPGASADQGVYRDRIELTNIAPRFPAPDLTIQYRYEQEWGHFQVAGILRRIEWEDQNPDQFDLSGEATGWGINLASVVNLGKNVLRLQVVYGEAIENYMNDAPADIGISNNFQDPVQPIVGEALPVLGVVAFLDLNWSERWTSTIGYSFVDIDNSDGQAADAFRKGKYSLVNLLYHPTEKVLFGPEIQWEKRENFTDGFESDDTRLQFSVKYNFGLTLGG